jgi:hypothetical protein
MQYMKVTGKMIKEKVLALKYTINNLKRVDSKDISKTTKKKVLVSEYIKKYKVHVKCKVNG